MAIPRSTRRFIESGNFDALEDEWLTRLTEDALDLHYFVAAGRAVAASGQETLARNLLELVDEHLVAAKAWDPRYRLLKGAGALIFPSESLHQEILTTLRELHPQSAVLEPMIEKLGLKRAVHDIDKTWQKAERFRSLMRFDRGTVVWMEGKGAGVVHDVNVELAKLRVDLGEKKVSVGFGGAGKVLRRLEADHFYARKLREPETLESMAAEEPARLLKLLLESEEEPLTAGTIRAAVRGLIPDSSWTSWWSSARSHPQVFASGKGARQVYRWASSHQEASHETLRHFESADLPHRLEIYRRESKRGAEASTAMRQSLLQTAADLAVSEPSDAFAIGLTLQQAGDPPPAELTPERLLTDTNDPAALVRSIDDKLLRRRAIALLRKCRSDWLPLFGRIFESETEPRLLSDLAIAMATEDASQLTAAFDTIVAHPRRRAAAFVWLTEHLTSFPFLEDRNPMQLMQLILRAEAAREFTPFRARLRKMIATAETLPHLIARLRPEQAEQAEQLLQRAPIEDYVRQPLINALHLRFPESFKRAEDVLYATIESIESRRRNLKQLLEEEIPANRKAIEEARELGDLRENFEYKAARQRHEYLTSRASALDADLRRARAVDFSRIDASEVRIGCRVALASDDGTIEFSILGPWESDPESGVLSYESETAKRLLGKRPGDEVVISESRWRVESIAPISGGS